MRISLPSVPLGWLGALGGRNTLLYVAYTTVLFVIFLIITFPHELLIRRALSNVDQGAVDVEIGGSGFAGLDGYGLSNLRVLPGSSDDAAPYLEFAQLNVRPAFAELVRGNPYAFVVSGDLYGGTLQGQIVYKGGTLTGTVEFQDLSLGRYQPLLAMFEEGQLAGRLSGQFNFEARAPNFAAGQGTGDLTLTGASLTSAKANGVTLPDAKLSRTKMKFIIGGGRVEIQEFNAAGDVDIQGTGTIQLRSPFGDSNLNLRATFLPSPATPETLKLALSMIPRQPGAKPDAPVNIVGPLTRARFR